ncbi:hypothetical protein [Streptomyces longwoodensis]|uniref:hypothetical protein n=1 Tax=Streptomyces longwoodensis TaxID=68231 RepID=UPI00385052E0
MSDTDSRRNFELSPAAQAALQEATQEIANEISLRAAANASKGGDDLTLIGVLDVAAALEESRNGDKQLRARIRSLFWASATYGIAGFGTVIFTILKYGVENVVQLFAALFTGVGVPAVSYWLLGLLNTSFSRKENQAKRSEQLEILQSWLMLESSIRAHYGSKYGESRASVPITQMIRVLERDGVIDSVTLEKIQRTQRARNVIAHGGDPRLTRSQVADLQKDSRSALRSIEQNWQEQQDTSNTKDS